MTVALLVPAAAAAQPTSTEDPTEAAAGWLAGELVDDAYIEVTFDFGDGPQTFPDQGLTADVVLALAGAGIASDRIEAATDWLEQQVGVYTGTGSGEVYAGSVAKLLLVAEATERSTTFGGEDLVALLEEREQDSGRFTDDSESGDFSNAITQALALLALERVEGAEPSGAAVGYLADQACDDGGFPEQFDAEQCTSQVDATGYVVQALLAVGETQAAEAAVDWLVAEQDDDGGFEAADDGANANSTGLAAAALTQAGESDAADDARDFLLSLQTRDCELGAGSVRFDADDGGDPVRATAQALPGLTGTSLAEVSAGGAASEIPTFDCPTFPDVDEDNVHAGAISELARREVVGGRDDGGFAPAVEVTRGQLATIVAQAAGLGPVEEGSFSDVAGHTHEEAIDALAEDGIVTGYADGTFRPDLTVQRDQVASILARWLELDPVDEDRFGDIEDSVHREQINALAEVEVARGTEDGDYRPARAIRRDQTASLVLRALRLVDPAGELGSGTAGR